MTSTVARTAHPHRRAADTAVARTGTNLHFAVGRTRIQLELPPTDKLGFYAGLLTAAGVGLIEWPIAVATGVGHLLSDDRHNRALRALGDALDAM